MIVAESKPFDEIRKMVENYRRILVAGCGTCVAVCLSGGDKEAAILSQKLQLSNAADPLFTSFSATVERQCDREFLSLFDEYIKDVDAIISLACGAGIQFLADEYPEIPVFPGVNTSFIGVSEGAGIWSERCRSCNQCYLGLTGGICPVTMCAKGLLNGPCGGPQNGKCETDPEKDCAWVRIIERLQSQSRLDLLVEVVSPRRHSLDKYPARVVRKDIQQRFK